MKNVQPYLDYRRNMHQAIQNAHIARSKEVVRLSKMVKNYLTNFYSRKA